MSSTPRDGKAAPSPLPVLALAALLGLSPSAAPAQTPPGPDPLVKDARIAGQDVPVPTRKKYVAPTYPADAAADGVRGIVILQVVIGEDGHVIDARVTRSIPGLDEAAVQAVKLWEYEPTTLNGQPVKVLLSQSITFALRLPELQREVGIPELKSGGTPFVPRSLTTPESAAVSVSLGRDGQVTEAAVLDGEPALSEALLRAVRAWRFSVTSEQTHASFSIRAEWTPGPQQRLVLRAYDLQTGDSEVAGAAPAAPAPSSPSPAGAPPTTAPGVAGAPSAPAVAAAPAPAPEPEAETEVLTARPEPPHKEEGVSSITDVTLGENIPDLVKGRRPTWPPLARLGNAMGEVEVRFSVDLAGRVTVHTAEGPELLTEAAEQAVATWIFRRTAIDRLNLVATFTYDADRSVAKVVRAQ